MQNEVLTDNQSRSRRFAPLGIIFGLIGLVLFAYFVSQAGLGEIVSGPMGIPRVAEREVESVRLRRELSELSTREMDGVIAIVCGAQASGMPTTRFSIAKMLARERPTIPIVVSERGQDLAEMIRYYGGTDIVHVFSDSPELHPGKIHIIAPKAAEKTLEILLAFVTACHTRATSAL